ncbi:hypothetical protein [Roseibium sp. MMSF_3412]|uniref:hypothetical protein n=1 Tax=unclassified Roseibium TaxID=2629323 RepID=UPI00273E4CF0|nr:hypothetical protein [Roseibium sp. MMSF_3412]
MTTVSDSSSASYDVAKIRNEFALNAVKDQAEQEQQVASRLEDAQATREEDRRENRKIPGLGEAVDITV